MIFPVKKPYRIGMRFRARTWYPPFRHAGLDVLPKIPGNKQSVYNPKDGYVKQWIGGACQGLQIRHTDGTESRMCHFSSLKVSVGQKIKQGAYIGNMGNRGLSRGVHLHWVTWKNGKLVDPLKLIEPESPLLDKDLIKLLFTQIWNVKPALGDWKVFYTRVKLGSIKTRNGLINNIKFWHSVVYKNGKLSKEGNKRWQRNKDKWLLK